MAAGDTFLPGCVHSPCSNTVVGFTGEHLAHFYSLIFFLYVFEYESFLSSEQINIFPFWKKPGALNNIKLTHILISSICNVFPISNVIGKPPKEKCHHSYIYFKWCFF